MACSHVCLWCLRRPYALTEVPPRPYSSFHAPFFVPKPRCVKEWLPDCLSRWGRHCWPATILPHPCAHSRRQGVGEWCPLFWRWGWPCWPVAIALRPCGRSRRKNAMESIHPWFCCLDPPCRPKAIQPLLCGPSLLRNAVVSGQ